jgi:hypothetical protein
MGGAPTMESPPPTPIAPAPSPVDASVLEARRRAKRKALTESGRKSTLLTGATGTEGSPTLGTPTLLGGGGT